MSGAPGDAFLGRLLREHGEMESLLAILDGEITTLEGGEPMRLILLLDAFKYLMSFPDLFHHPSEDEILRRVQAHTGAESIRIERLFREHQELAGMAKDLYRMIECARAGEPVSRDSLVAKLKEYVAALRQHMAVEEAEFFPLARTTLSETEWIAATNAIHSARDDQVFGKPLESEYEQLLRQIRAEAVP